ncbi:MAG: hypothetical protein ACW99L_19105 [Promethearchaeota archaeon]
MLLDILLISTKASTWPCVLRETSCVVEAISSEAAFTSLALAANSVAMFETFTLASVPAFSTDSMLFVTPTILLTVGIDTATPSTTAATIIDIIMI